MTLLMAPGRTWHWLVLLAAVALALAGRLDTFNKVYRTDPTRILSPDSPTYDNPAQALLKHGRFASSPDRPGQPEIVRTPGYPLFIAGVYLLFGIHHYPVIVAQILLSGVTMVLVFFACLGLRGRRAGVIAAILLALEPLSFLYSQFLLTETLFTFFVALCAVAGIGLIRARRRETRRAVALGLGIAALTHVRPVGYFLIFPVLLGMLAAKRFQGAPARQLLRLGAGLFLPWLVLVGGWQVRNTVVAGTSEFSAIQSINLFQYRAAGVVALRDGITLDEARKKLEAELGDVSKLPPAERYRAYRRASLKLFRQHPGLTLTMMGNGLYYLLLTMPDLHIFLYLNIRSDVTPIQNFVHESFKDFYDFWIRQHLDVFLIASLLTVPLSYLLYLGLLFAPWFRGRPAGETVFIHLFLAGLLLYLLLLSAGPEANYRLRLPLVPLVAIYSAIGWDKFLGALVRPGKLVVRLSRSYFTQRNDRH